MRSIDVHAHLAPANAMNLENGQEWHGYVKAENQGVHLLVEGERRHWIHPSFYLSTEERLEIMDSLNVDVHVLSTWSQLYNYHFPTDICVATSKDCNDHISDLVKAHPKRFAGLGTLPMQDVNAAIAELERTMNQLGFKGAMINDQINGRALDEPEYLPFWKAAEQMGALIFFHQVENETMVEARTTKYGLGNSIGNLADRTVAFASLVFGGVMDKCPDLKVCFAHGGGYTCFGAGRMDRGWQVRSEARVNIQQPPSKYLSRFYYDCLTQSEPVLRYIIDTVGVERVVLGSDWPYNMGIDSPVEWINSLESLTQDEKEAILWKNLETLLGI